jgi:L-ascorbate metabolism protein UlaG (beta-lactamase superfamily)
MSRSQTALRWLGHATVLIELDRVRVLTDPVLRHRIGPLVRVAPPVGSDTVTALDAVLLSHLHADHAHLQSLRDTARDAPLVVPYPAGAWLRRKGLRDVRELRSGDRMTIGPVSVTATPAHHERRRRPFGPAADPLGYVVQGTKSVYFAGDTDLMPAMAELRGSIDVALLPVWGWGPSVGPGHLDPTRAARAVALIEPAVAIPIHWGTFALGLSGRGRPVDERPAREFAALVKRGSPEVDVRVLVPGERTTI